MTVLFFGFCTKPLDGALATLLREAGLCTEHKVSRRDDSVLVVVAVVNHVLCVDKPKHGLEIGRQIARQGLVDLLLGNLPVLGVDIDVLFQTVVAVVARKGTRLVPDGRKPRIGQPDRQKESNKEHRVWFFFNRE